MQDPTSTSDRPVDVTIVLPVYNEAGHLAEELDRIRSATDTDNRTYELLVVDDGSTDGSRAILESRGDIRLIRLPNNRGSGHARRMGTQLARGRVVVWTDVDMTYPNDQIPWLVSQLDEGWDQVVGARTSEAGTHRFARVPAKWFIRKLASYLVDESIPDLNSGFRAFRKRVALPYLHLLPNGFSCVTTITMAFLANGHALGYVPIEYRGRSGQSKFHWRKDTSRYILQIIRMIMQFNPLRVFLPVGGFMLLLAAGKLGFDIIDKDWRISANAIVLCIVAFQVVALGLLADLVARSTSRQPPLEY